MSSSITKQELACIDEHIESERSLGGLRELTQRLAGDLRLAHDRPDRSPRNSSMPSGNDACEDMQAPQGHESGVAAEGTGDSAEVDTAIAAKVSRRPDRQRGAKGHGRTQRLAMAPPKCTPGSMRVLRGGAAAVGGCRKRRLGRDRVMPLHESAQPAHQVVGAQRLGMRLEVTRHVPMQQRCTCGHVT